MHIYACVYGTEGHVMHVYACVQETEVHKGDDSHSMDKDT